MRAFATLLLLLAASGAVAQTTTLYASDFEADNGGWVGTGDWQWGTPAATPDRTGCFSTTSPFPTGAASGVNVWGTNLAGCHAPSEDARLSHTFDLSTAGGMPQFCWNQFIDSGGNTFDMASLEVNGTRVYLSTGSSAAAYQQQCVDLTPYVGQASVEIAFRFVTSAVVNRAGWYVDDVAITTMGVASGAAPQVGFALSPVRPNPLRDRGQLSLSVDQTQAVTVDLVNTLGQRVATVFEGLLASGQTATLTLDTSGLAAGVYLVRVTGETVHGAVRITVQR